MLMRQKGNSLTSIAQQLKRSASTLSRELKRNNVALNHQRQTARHIPYSRRDARVAS